MANRGKMHENTTYDEKIIRQVCPIFQKLEAVYVLEDGTLERYPIHAIVWYDTITRDILTKKFISKSSDFEYLEFRRIGSLFLTRRSPELLGYEVEGENYDWKTDITIYFIEKER